MSDTKSFDPELVPALVPEVFAQALENSGIYYFRYFPQNQVVIIPEATRRLWGTDLHHAKLRLGMAESYIAEAHRTSFIDMFEEIEGGAEAASATFCLKDMKTWFHIDMTTTARSEDGMPLEAVAIIDDITSIKIAEMEFANRNDMLSYMMQIFEKAAIATGSIIFIYDYVNGTAVMPEGIARSWGMPPTQPDVPYGLAESDFAQGKSKETFIDIHEQIMNGAREANGRVYLKRENGKTGYYELTFIALYDNDGNPTGKAVGIYQDITKMHEQVMHQATVTRALAEGISAAFYVDLDENTFSIENISDYTSKPVMEFLNDSSTDGSFLEKIDYYVDNFVSEEDYERMHHETRIETLIERIDKHKSYYVQYRVKNEDEDKGYYEMHVVKANDSNGGNNAFISFRGIDDQKSQEMVQRRALQDAFEAAEQANHAKTTFLSRMSHDIRTPMNAIISMTAIAATNIDNTERVKDCLGKITVSSKHLLGLINEVLDMSKIESGKLDLNIEEFDIAKLIDGLLDMSRQEIKAKNQTLSVDVQGIIHEYVAGDAQRIQQVFMNLLSNAIKYTPEGGAIKLTISEKPTNKTHTGCYEFVFEDNGIGMSEDFLKRVFEPFSRAADDKAMKQQGTGLGMAIANNIVQLMNGNIKIESEEGVGTKVIVTIYLGLVDTSHDESGLFADLPVLVVDDDVVTCETACAILEELGMTCDWVLNGKRALERTIARHEEGSGYFATIVDWKMPGMDGLETTRAIRKVIGDEAPIIIISAYDWTEIEDKALAAGASGFIGKPLFRSRLVRLFKTLLNGSDEDVNNRRFNNTLADLAQQDFSGKRALLVEDNLLNAEIASEILKTAHLEIDHALNGQEAFDMFERSDDGYYDIVFMDIQMPVMNGYEATRAIRGIERAYAKDVPIIAMTADAFAEDVKATREVGMNEHIAKPIDFDVLIDTLNRWLG